MAWWHWVVVYEEGSWDLGVFGKCPENEYTSSDKTGVTLVYWARTDWNQESDTKVVCGLELGTTKVWCERV